MNTLAVRIIGSCLLLLFLLRFIFGILLIMHSVVSKSTDLRSRASADYTGIGKIQIPGSW